MKYIRNGEPEALGKGHLSHTEGLSFDTEELELPASRVCK